jgi:hypothetical protein
MNPSDIKSRLETAARSPGECSNMFLTKTFAEALLYIMEKAHAPIGQDQIYDRLEKLEATEKERRKACICPLGVGNFDRKCPMHKHLFEGSDGV